MARRMKDSGVEWIGEIPEEWELKRLQFCLNEKNEKNSPVKTNQILSLVKDKGVMLYEDKGNQGNKAKEDVSQYKLAYPNTLIVNSMNILIGSVGISSYFGCISPVYYVFEETGDSNLRYIDYIFYTREFQKELRKYANGILEIRLRVSSEDIFKREIPLPDKERQIIIADFLDEKVKEIDFLIAKTKETIEDYRKYKQAIITDAVIKGLNPNVKMKESGIEYLKMIPCNWEIVPISIAFDFIGGYAYKSEKFCGETPYQVIRLGNVKNDNLIIEEKRVFIDEEYAKESEKSKILEDDILFTMTGTKGKKDYFYTLIVKSKDIKKKQLFLNQRVGCFRKAINEVFMPYYNYPELFTPV